MSFADFFTAIINQLLTNGKSFILETIIADYKFTKYIHPFIKIHSNLYLSIVAWIKSLYEL